MTLTFYNTLTRTKEPFTPLEPGKIKMYCCGVTVYDYCHLGHARSYIVWDVMRRYLEWLDYKVQYVQNFTDIDDKILNRAKRDGISMQEVSQKFIDEYFEDMGCLNVLEADQYPRVTEHIHAIHQLIQTLETQGKAYAVGGDVYYRVQEFPDYGKLSGRNLDDMQAGASGRVTEENQKQHPFDFALWKAAKPGEPSWDSPWGKGRPGWHIECSAMVKALLGETIDIHGGGGDLIFPHHENEIAQSEAVNHQPLARYWLHNGMVKINGEKMSKSLGNFITIREFLGRSIDPMVLRLFVLQGHYRKPLDFTEAAIASAQNSWNTLQEGLRFGQQYGSQLGWQAESTFANPYKERFQSVMNDDMNVPGGLAIIFEIAKELRKEGNLLVHQGTTETLSSVLEEQWHALVELAQVLGLEITSEETSAESSEGLNDEEIEDLIQQRVKARKAKNFAEADRIRDQLNAQNLTVIDSSEGTRWHRN